MKNLKNLNFEKFKSISLTKQEREMLINSAKVVVAELEEKNHSLADEYGRMIREAETYEWFSPVNFKQMLIEADGCVSEDAFNALYEVLKQLADNESKRIDGGSCSGT